MKFVRHMLKKIIIFVTLMLLIFFFYYMALRGITKIKQDEEWNREYFSESEFVRTIDCSPIIDQYGVEKKYYLSFEIKAECEGNVMVYFQNGSNTKYYFEKNIEVTTEYRSFGMVVIPMLDNDEIIQSYLAFYGEYGSGRKPTIRRIKFEVMEEN